MLRVVCQVCCWNVATFCVALPALSQPAPLLPVAESPADVLTAEQWARTDAAVDRALEWLAAQQMPDGSFPVARHGAAWA